MAFAIVTADQRLSAVPNTNIILLAPTGWGKTYQARTLDPETTLFVNAEAGDLALADWKGDVFNIREQAALHNVHPWEAARAMACLISGPDPAGGPNSPYGKTAFDWYEATFGPASTFAKYKLIYWDSITVASRWCFSWSKMQPQAFSEKTGKPDTRGAYGLLGQEMVTWLSVIQHTPGKSTICVGILDRMVDDLKRITWEPQIEGGKTGREAPGIFDIVLTGADLTTADGTTYKAFVCHQFNQFGFPAKDRSGCLELLEPAELRHGGGLGMLVDKVRARKRIDGALIQPQPIAAGVNVPEPQAPGSV